MSTESVKVTLRPIEVTVKSSGQRVTVSASRVQIATAGKVGPPGPSGDIGLLSLTAATILSGHRAITTNNAGDAIYADKNTPSHVSKVLGVCTHAAIAGATIAIKTFGELTEPSWNWTPGGSIYLNANGILTQTPPTTGFSLELAYALTPTTIFISLKQPFVRS